MKDFEYYLFDYADVISLPQEMTIFYQMARILQMSDSEFHAAYWKFRKPYDLGQAGKDYWPLVAGKVLPADMINELIDHDCRSWGRINPVTVKYLESLKDKHKRTGLLSNLPIDLVHYLRKNFDFFELMDDVFFSAEIQLVKPEVCCYQHVLSTIRCAGPDVIFYDDREENLRGAEKLGMNTFLVTQSSLYELL